MTRIKPCQYCKIRRRKCEKPSPLEPCKLCHRLKKKCVPQLELQELDVSTESEDNTDNEMTHHFETVYFQIKQLEQQINTFEKELARETAMVKKQKRWHLEKQPDRLRLLSNFKNLQELLQYGQCAIRYLSPFGRTFIDTPLSFQLTVTGAMNILFKMVAQHHHQRNMLPASSSPNVIKHRFADGIVQYIQPRNYVTQLIDLYFECQWPHVPLLHEASFRKHLDTLSDPLLDPITMAICTQSSLLQCTTHALFNAKEQRYMSEIYYDLSMQQLVEIFDDPDRALDALITIDLLQSFMMLTLRFDENYKWTGIASLLIANLKAEYPDYAKVCLDPVIRPKYAMIHRAINRNEDATSIETLVRLAQNSDIEPKLHSPLDILPDESDKYQMLLAVSNHWDRLYSTPGFILSSRFLSASAKHVKFQDLIRFEQIVTEWWQTVPDEFKWHSNPFHITLDHVEACNSISQVMMMLRLIQFSLDIQLRLLSPCLEGKENAHVPYSVIQERAIYLARQAFDVNLALSQKCKELEGFCADIHSFFLRSLDKLTILLQLGDQSISSQLRHVAHAYIQELESWSFPHSLKSATSPFSILSLTSSFEITNRIPLTELYRDYPAPGPALMFDVLHTTTSNLIKSLR